MILKKISLSFLMLTWFLSQIGLAVAMDETDTGTETEAEAWEKIRVPEAVCGNGAPYSIFMRKGDPLKLAFGFSGGGACWSYQTCFGPFAMTSLKATASVHLQEGIYSKDINKSALADFTHVYFPYCTGDVFLADHEAVYGGNKVHHKGRIQVALALEHLRNEKIVNFDNALDVVLFGHSAGAIASISHVPTFDPYLPRGIHKVVISDAPGLHFGKTFWSKFSSKLITDYTVTLERMGMVLNKEDGNVASQMPNYCQKFSDWRIGVIQSTKDMVMSSIFGNISQSEHARLVLGPKGIYQLTEDPSDNCSAWVPNSTNHTYLSSESNSQLAIGDKKALDFANDLVKNIDGQNYKEKTTEVE